MDEVNDGIRDLIPTTSFSKSMGSKYTGTINLYWNIKKLVSCGINRNTRGGHHYDAILKRIRPIKL